MRELDPVSWFMSPQHWDGRWKGEDRAVFLKILPARVAKRSQMTCLRQERGEGRSINSVLTGVCILPCFLGCPAWILRGKRGPQR